MTIRPAWFALAGLFLLAACQPKPPAPPPPELAWAYPKAPKADFPPVPPGDYSVPGSRLRLSAATINDDGNPPDWFPDSHPLPPPVVAHQRKDGPTPSGACHLMQGGGFLGAPSLAGLPAAYIKTQVLAFRSGDRRSAEPDRPATGEMIGVARKVTDTELDQAAAYFAALPRHPRFQVIESDTAPRTRPDYYGWLDRAPDGGSEPIGRQAVEVAADWRQMMLSDPNTLIQVYVAPGVLNRGEALVKTGGGGGAPCKGCHGADLTGGPVAPPLAGRSAAYLARMLWDIRSGARGGPSVAQMQAPAKGLSAAQITEVSAYLASLPP